MKVNHISVHTLSVDEAAKMTAANRYGAIWEPGVRVVIDNELCVLESRAEVEAVIADLRAAADKMYPAGETAESGGLSEK